MALELFFNAVITATKLSILFFYYTIFQVSQRFTYALIATGILCSLWFLGFTFATIFQCKPVHALWDTGALGQYCINSARLLLSNELLNCTLDVLILSLPIGMIRKLHLPLARRIQIAGIFLLGSL